MEHVALARPSEGLSILNLQSKTLPGAEYLQDLIDWSCDSVNAIDFWTGSGDIQHISYKALDVLTSTLAKQIAVALRAAGNHHDDAIVPVLVSQSPELYISWIAILKAGAAFCPIAIDSPAERIKFILQDVGASLVLTTAQHEHRMVDIAPKMKILSVSQSNLEACLTYTIPSTETDQGTRGIRRPDSLAYVMYTSGSTGLPKGVKISHQAASQALLAHDEHLPVFKRFLQFASPMFDVSVFETFFPLFRGATMVGRDREALLADLSGTMRAMDVDAAELTPTITSTLLKNREAAPCLRLLLTIGEMLSRPTIEEFGESDTQPGMLYAMYGPTEASIHCTIAARVSTSSSIHNIGVPLATVTAIIIEASGDETLEQYSILSKGQIGELAVSGQLASGYLNRPDQTAAAFIDLPNYGRLYRTGDRARITDDGTLEMLGRISSGQVKLRGQRVELGEIESIACKVHGVVMAAASIIHDTLVLFCVQDGGTTNIADIRSSCKRHLLPYMVPGDIVVLELERLPRLPSGKMDRKTIESEYVGNEIVQPQDNAGCLDHMTAQVCKSVSELFGRHISPIAPLWAEGLNSLLAIRLACALRAQKIEVSVRDLMELETIKDIVSKVKAQPSEVDILGPLTSTLIEDTKAWQDIEKIVEITLGDDVVMNKIEHILPCNAIQIAMLAETVSNMKLNFNSIKLEAVPGITADKIRAAMQQLAQKNEILRSGFVSIDHASMPFANVVWNELYFDQNLSLLHPLKIEPAGDAVNQFILQIHHALYDGWSWEIVVADLNCLLETRPISERPQFRDVSRKQRSVQEPQREAAEDYWRGQLATATPFRFPQLNPRRDTKHDQQWECRTFTTTGQSLVEFALQYRVSSQTVLTTAVSLLLSSYTGSSNVTFGLVSSGRHLPVSEIEKIIGPCLSTLPLSVDLSTVRTFQDLLLYIHTLQLDQLEHGALSLRDILAVAGMGAQQKLFDTLFIWQESLTSSEPNENSVRIRENRDCLDYVLVIEAEPIGSEIVVKLSYDTATVSSQHAKKFLAQFDHLVSQIISDIEMSLSNIWDHCDLDLLAVANTKARPFDMSFDLTSTVQDLAETSPDRVAVAFTHDFDPDTGATDVEKITYNDLWVQSNQIAQYLRRLGIRAEEVVCVLAEKSLDLYVLDFSIIVAGSVFLNIDIRTPSERVSQILREVKCKLIITDHDHIIVDALNNSGQLWIPLSTIKAEAQQYQKEVVSQCADAAESRLAYVVMTSGTTGIPKAILVTKENLLSNIDVLSKLYPRYGDHDRLLQACSPAFDVFVFELFWTWHMGLCLCSSTNDVLFRDIEGFIRASKVSHLSLTPSVAALVRPENVPNVKFLVTAGEPMNSKVFNDWAGRGLFQGYGPAETTNISNVKGPLQRHDLINNAGAPFSNTSIFICAKQDDENPKSDVQILPIGAIGEILIRGDQVARGYTDLNLTAISFITTKYGRLYRSGDMGRLLDNGDLIVLGRQDDQVKLRGQRIELGDINTAITRASFVADAVTFLTNGNDLMARLVSFWTKSGVEQPQNAVSRLYELLEANLPPYMVPEMLIPIEAMPLTRQGKIDRNNIMQHFTTVDDLELRQFSRGAPDLEADEEFMEGEMPIAQAVSEVTGTIMSSIRPNTSFYSLGLDSISSVRLSQKLRQANVGRVGVSLILRHCSVRRLRRAMVDSDFVPESRTEKVKLDEIFDPTWRSTILDMAEAQGHPVEKLLPCTPLQESILVSQANTPNSAVYQARMRFEVNGDVNRLRDAWSSMVTRHQILRTGFTITPSADHVYAQIVFKHFQVPCYSSNEESSTAFIASKDSILPPWRLILHNGGAVKPASFTLMMSHALYDFEALEILLRETEICYKLRDLRPVVSPDAYVRYVATLDEDEVDTFWRSRLESCVPRSFTDLFESEEANDETQRRFTHTSRISLQRLQTAAEQYSATSSALYHAAWGRLLSCYMKDEDVIFGNVFSGRDLPVEGLTDIVAPIFNTLPLRIQVKSRQSMRDLVATTQRNILEILPFQPSPLHRIVRNQQLYGQPLFDTLVLVQNRDLALNASIWTLLEEQGDMHFPGVIIETVPDAQNDRLIFKLYVQSEKMDSSTAQQILKNYDVLLDEIMHYPQAQSTNFASINFNLPLLHATSVNSTKSRTQQLLHNSADKKALTDLELSIRKLFTQLSGIDAVNIRRTTNIFELGLDSLHVVQIASSLRGLGYNVTGADVLEAKTLGRLSEVCIMGAGKKNCSNSNVFDLQTFDQNHRPAICEQLQISNTSMQTVRPCTSTQSGILTEFINSKGELYFNSLVLKFDSNIDLRLMKNAWQIVMDRNEMLRTGFVILNTSQHPYCMVTYVGGACHLPWLAKEDVDGGKAISLGLECLQSLHNPCWRLLLKKLNGLTQLEVRMLHSLYDANSLDGLLSEVAATYRGQELSLPSIVPVTPTLLAILDQSEASTQNSGDFWESLGSEVQPSRFPNLNIHQNVWRDSVTVSRSYDSLREELEKGCRRMGVTLQSVCQIAWARLLAAYTGDSKVIFGVILSGRTLPETANASFPTINTVPFSIKVRVSTEEMLVEANEINVGLFKHQFTPMTTIKNWLQMEGDAYDTILVLQQNQAATEDGRPWEIVDDRAAAEYAISMEVVPESNDAVKLRVTTRLDVVPQDYARILLDQYEALLRETVQENPGTRLMPEMLMSVVPAKDIQISTKVRFLHDLVQETTTKTPKAIALEFASSIVDGHIDKQSWTYGQLHEESNKIANLLLAHGVKPGSLVAVCFNKCPEAYFAILGTLKSGCAYVAIDPAAPFARKEFILNDARCKVLLTTESLFISLDDISNTTVLAVDNQELLNCHPTINPILERELQPSDTCYCLYTSGTTGQPKGCLISHASAVQAMLSFQRIFAGHWDSNSRFLQFASFHFDVSVLEQYWSWSVGICVTSAPRDVLFEDLPGVIDALKITHLDLTPSLARLMKPEQVPSLCRGVFIVGGEQVTQDIVDTWGDAGCLYNFYGPSEVTIGCTVHKRMKKGVKATNIGQPWDIVGAFVLEPASEIPVLRGAVGELCLSGPLVGKGYLNRPELTAEKFVTLKQYKIQIYRTGDLVRLLHDDSFEFLGRIDDQIKLRGQRLEIREIDHSITQSSESILNVATIVMKHVDQPSEQLIAFFTIRGQVAKSSRIAALTSPDAEDLVLKARRYLQDVLPAYMVPTHLLPVSHIPLSANNKADLKALKAFFVAMPFKKLQNMDWNGSKIMSTSLTARKIIVILAAFLELPEMTIGPSSRMFELGLDSISAVAFASLLRKEGFRHTDAATIMRRPVVADLARELDASEEDDYEKSVSMAKHKITQFQQAHKGLFSPLDNIKSVWPCTALQEDMLSKTENGGEIPYYLSAFHYALDKTVTSDAVINAWTLAQGRFSILRTTFIEVSTKQYAQLVRPHCFAPVRYRKLAPAENVMAIFEQNTSQWCNEVKVLGNEPCWEIEMLGTSTGQIYMSLRIFHGLYDANSLAILLKEVAGLLGNAATQPGKQALEFHQTLAYGPLCQRSGAQQFWVTRLSNPVLLNIPPVHNRSENSSTTYTVEYVLPKDYAEARNGLAVTDSAIFQAACQLCLHVKYGVFPTLGMVVSGRSFPVTGVEDICGPLFNTIPFDVTPKSNWSRADFIKACHEFNVESKRFEHTPLKEIRKWIGLEASRILFDTLFVFQREATCGVDESDEFWKEIGQSKMTDYPLNIEVNLKKENFKLTVIVDPEFLGENDLHSLSSDFLSVFEQLISEPNGPLFPKQVQDLTNRQIQPAQTVRLHETINTDILQNVKSQVALLAQQDVSNLAEDVNVFSLGLDSISLIRLSGALRKVGLPISVNVIMRLSTPIQIAQYLTERNTTPSTVPQTLSNGQKLLEAYQSELKDAMSQQDLSLDRFEKVWPVTPMQEGVLANFEKYYHFALLKLSTDTDLNRLQIAWDSSIKSHTVLRARFIAVDDPNTKHVFAQLITNAEERKWETVYINVESQINDMIDQKYSEMAEAGVNYPPINIHFIIASDSGNQYILLGMSHAIYDGWSIQLLHQDILSLYNGQQVQRPPLEPYLQYIMGRPLRGAEEFWTEQMSNYVSKPFNSLAKYPATDSKAHKMTIESRTQSSKLRRFCMEHSVTVQNLGLTIWTAVLASYLHTYNICFGVVLACRDTEEVDQLIFPTFNTVPFRPRFKGGSHLDLLKHIHQLSSQIAEHQDFPLREIKKLHSRSSEVSAELFDTLFVMQKRPSSDTTFLKLYEEVDLGESLNLEYPVNLEMDLGDTLSWTVAADKSALDRQGMKELFDALEGTLEAVLLRPNDSVMDISESEQGPEVVSKMLALISGSEQDQEAHRETRTADSVLRSTIFDAVASVARCSVASLSGKTNIYSIGLDSISVIKVAGLLKKKGIALPVSKIIAAVTLDRIVSEARRTGLSKCSVISPDASTSSAALLPESMESILGPHGIVQTAIETTLPASAAQIFMLDFYQASGGRLFYPTFRYRIAKGTIPEEQICHAWEAVVQIFPVLRTRFIKGYETVWQVVIQPDAVDRYSPATHLTVLQEPEGTFIQVRLHHALYDAVSMPIIISAFKRACQSQVSRPRTSATTLPRFISATRGHETSRIRRKFWREHLERARHSSHLPLGSFGARRIEVVEMNAIPDVGPLITKAAAVDASLQAVLLAVVGRAYAGLLPFWQDSVVLGVYLANRGLDIEGLDELAAPTVSVVPLVVDVKSDVFESARKVQADLAMLQKAEHCGVSLQEIYRWTGVRIDCFVNSVPRVEDVGDEDLDMYGDGTGDGDVSGRVGLVSYPLESREEVISQGQDLVSPFLGSEPPAKEMPWCVPSIDVEAKLEVDGGLTIGVFAPEDKLSEVELRQMLEEIKK